ncbi:MULTISPECIES: CAAD domain-containing protein [Aerosakkonema]|uniref:CAAD domain-containing protein n=1 Tax=Aerosakkonema TaxID=1246629 RepID=UPI0035B6AC7C
METKQPQVQQTDTPKVEVTVQGTDTAPLAKLPPADSSANAQWQEYWDQFVLYLSNLQDYLGVFFVKYQKPLVAVGLIVAAFVSVKVTLAVLEALNDIPLLSPFFELVGIGYSGWFVYRYLLKASSRQELTEELNTLKNQVLGGSSGNVGK